MKSLLLISILLVSLATLTGCATSPFGTATSGGANYSYSRTAAGDCTVTINSAREIAGAQLMIDQNCSVTVTAQQAGGADALRVIGDLVGKIP